MTAAVAVGEGRASIAVADIQRELEEARGEADRAERDGDLGRAAELRYGLIPDLEKQLARGRERRQGRPVRFLKEEVDCRRHRRGRRPLDGHPGRTA